MDTKINHKIILIGLSSDQAILVHKALTSNGFKDTGHDGNSSIFHRIESEGPWFLIVWRGVKKPFITISNSLDLIMGANHWFEGLTKPYNEIVSDIEELLSSLKSGKLNDTGN